MNNLSIFATSPSSFSCEAGQWLPNLRHGPDNNCSFDLRSGRTSVLRRLPRPWVLIVWRPVAKLLAFSRIVCRDLIWWLFHRRVWKWSRINGFVRAGNVYGFFRQSVCLFRGLRLCYICIWCGGFILSICYYDGFRFVENLLDFAFGRFILGLNLFLCSSNRKYSRYGRS